MAVITLLAAHQAANDLLTCACEALDRIPTEVPGLNGCPCRVGVVPGAPAADGCDEGCGALPAGEYPGQLTVNVVRTYVTARDRFPRYEPSAPDSVRDSKQCRSPLVTAIDLAVTLYRCVPLPSDQGCPPTMAELTESAMQLHVDMMALQYAVTCCYSATDTTQRNGRRYTMGASTVLGPQGGCVGVQQIVTVALDGCVPCPPEEP